MRHRTTAALAVGAALLALAGCSDSSGDSKPAMPGGQGVDAVNQDVKAPAPVKIGTPVKIVRGDSAIEMTAVQVVDPATTTSFSKVLAPTERLIAVQWRITAPGPGPVSEYPAMQSGVYDDQGQRYGADPVRKVASGPAFPDGTSIPAGDTALGYVAYIVPATAKITKIQFSPGISLPQNAGTWTL
ncbi:hypothetical protein ACFRCG_41785 [Embleya sp. NPDC056575]|uniref:hypothetical protein n=1 Tax=unclassified Embleya TaxID=2699296 RepID=UPI0036C7EEF7